MKCTAAMSCSEIAHVELLIRRPCGHKKCIYRGEHYKYGDDKDAHSNDCKYHTLAYYIRDIAGDPARGIAEDQTVACTVDGAYHRYNGSTFVQLRTLKPVQIDMLEAFVTSQLGVPYRKHNFNFICCGLFAIGTTHDDLLDEQGIVDAKQITVREGWFCSELIVSALIHANIINDLDINPSISKPNDIFQYIKKYVPNVLINPKEFMF